MTTQKAMQQDVKSDFKDAMHSVHEGFNDLREDVGEARKVAIESTKHHLEEGFQKAKSVASDLLDNTAGKIGQNPMTAVLVAAGIGCLAGYLLSRKWK